MAFIGNTNTTQAFTPGVDYFSGNGSTTAFTLSRPVASVAQIEAFIENVPQTPNTAYTVSGNTITFTSAPPSGTNNIYVYYTSPITQVIAPGQGTVNTTSLAGGTITTTADASINGVTVGKGGGAVAGNTAVGYQALYTNTTAVAMTAFGYQAAYTANTNSVDAFGYQAAYATTGANNVAIGAVSLKNNTTGANNTAVGRDALYSNTSSNYNTAVGWQAGYSYNTASTNSLNVYLGIQAGYSQTAGTFSTFVGPQAGYYITTGSKNTILGGYNGNQGGLDIRTASNRIVLSDGDGNPRLYYDNNGAIQSTSAVGNNTLYPAFFARAWVCFAGPSGSISGSGGITSVSRTGTGQWLVAFSFVMPDTTYACVTGLQRNSANGDFINEGFNRATTSTYVEGFSNGASADLARVQLAFFR